MIESEILFTSSCAPSRKDVSKIGGFPFLPRGMECPTCAFCDARLTLFVQVRIGVLIYPIMYCTACSSDEGVTPGRPKLVGDRVSVPRSFLAGVQDCWHVGRYAARDCEEKTNGTNYIIERELGAGSEGRAGPIVKIGGSPKWFQGDETPRCIVDDGGKTLPLIFVCQVYPDLLFPISSDAPFQIGYDMIARGEAPYTTRTYDIFLRNSIYLFESEAGDLHIISQKS